MYSGFSGTKYAMQERQFRARPELRQLTYCLNIGQALKSTIAFRSVSIEILAESDTPSRMDFGPLTRCRVHYF